MKTKRLGRTGLKVSEICLGTMTFGWQCDEEASRSIMDAAFDAGVTFIDSADVYPMGGGLDSVGRTEESVGRWLKERRHEVVVATKCRGAMGAGPNDAGLSRKHVMDAVEGSLRRLQTDYIDLYQVHQPDYATPQDETLRALDDLVRQGKVRYLGCSNYPAWLLARALWISDKLGLARFDSVQPRYNMIFREIEAELLPLCRDQGVGVIPYNPLAGGFLTGKYTDPARPPAGSRMAVLAERAPDARVASIYRARYWHEPHFDVVARLRDFFAKRGKPLAQVALAWVRAQPGITSPIVGASSPEQLRESLGAVELTLDEDAARCLRRGLVRPTARPRDDLVY